ncbi:MAG: streptomycin adenylyltransferase [Clostridiales bacterium]|nr:streptomycin adenylyltransferase [Clostridiales bacterium]
MAKADEIIRQLLLRAREEDVKALILMGSAARVDHGADEYSDVDIIAAVTGPERWLNGEAKGEDDIVISFTEPTFGGGKERRMLLKRGLDVDLMVFTPSQLTTLTLDGTAAKVLGRGYRVLYDAMGITPMLNENMAKPQNFGKPMDAQVYEQLTSDFYFHVVWAEKKLRRGELWTAMMCIDGYLKRLLLKMVEAQAQLEDPAVDVWYEGRHLRDWAPMDVMGSLKDFFARFDAEDLAQALLYSTELFTTLAHEVACKMGCSINKMAEAYVYKTLLPRLKRQAKGD